MADVHSVEVVERSTRQRPSRASTRGLDRFRELLGSGRASANSYVLLVGLDTFDSLEIIQSVKHGLPYRAFDLLIANTALPSQEALVLVNISSRTLSRRKHERRFHQDESDRLLRASRVFARALSLFDGNRDAARAWLSEPKRALGGEVPLTVASTEVGALDVERLIGRLEHGIFT
jgi:putative toxin-antitoxin system antitoxin component (TIGR02293 family)